MRLKSSHAKVVADIDKALYCGSNRKKKGNKSTMNAPSTHRRFGVLGPSSFQTATQKIQIRKTSQSSFNKLSPMFMIHVGPNNVGIIHAVKNIAAVVMSGSAATISGALDFVGMF